MSLIKYKYSLLQNELSKNIEAHDAAPYLSDHKATSFMNWYPESKLTILSWHQLRRRRPVSMLPGTMVSRIIKAYNSPISCSIAIRAVTIKLLSV